MRTEDGKIRLTKLARIQRRLAELSSEEATLHAEEAALFEQLAEGGSLEPRAGRRPSVRKLPEARPVSELDQARAAQALSRNEIRRRIRL